MRLDIASIDRHWHRADATYDASAFIQRAIGERLLERLSYMQVTPKQVLNVSWRPSDIAAGLRKLFPDAVIEDGAKTQTGTRADWLMQLPFPDNHFDCCIGNLSLSWVPDFPKVLAELYRVLKPGGMLLYTTLGIDTLKELRASFDGVDTHAHVIDFIDMHHIGDAMLHLGYQDPVVDVQQLTFRYNGLTQLFQDLKGSAANNMSLDRPRHLMTPRQWQKMCAAYDNFKVDNQYPVTVEMITGHAWMPKKPVQKTNASGEVSVSVDQIKGLS